MAVEETTKSLKLKITLWNGGSHEDIVGVEAVIINVQMLF